MHLKWAISKKRLKYFYIIKWQVTNIQKMKNGEKIKQKLQMKNSKISTLDVLSNDIRTYQGLWMYCGCALCTPQTIVFYVLCQFNIVNCYIVLFCKNLTFFVEEDASTCLSSTFTHRLI